MTNDRFRVPESVLVVVYARPDQVLLLERRDRPGFWQSVTGSLEPGEAPRDAARRELAEETGLDGEPADLGQALRDFFGVPASLSARRDPQPGTRLCLRCR